jgi:hypothetical protein
MLLRSRVGLVFGVVVVITVGCLTAVHALSSASAIAVDRSSAATVCPTDAAGQKCYSEQVTPTQQLPPPPTMAPPGPTDPPALPQIECGTGFFDASTASELTTHFGSVDACFRFADENYWFVLFDGLAPDQSNTAPGGAVLAIEACTAGSITCLNPEAAHDFVDFVVEYPPDPSPGRVVFLRAVTDALIAVADGNCGDVVYDVQNGSWYPGTIGPSSFPPLVDSASDTDLVTPSSATGRVVVPQPTTGPTGAPSTTAAIAATSAHVGAATVASTTPVTTGATGTQLTGASGVLSVTSIPTVEAPLTGLPQSLASPGALLGSAALAAPAPQAVAVCNA